MHTTETHHRFIELRAQGLSLARIADELHVSKPTLIAWQRQFYREIAELKSVELEALQEKFLASHGDELARLAGHLNRVENILARRNLEVISTEFLFSMAAALRSQIRKQKLPTDLSPLPPDGPPESHPQPSTPNPQPANDQP